MTETPSTAKKTTAIEYLLVVVIVAVGVYEAAATLEVVPPFKELPSLFGGWLGL